MMLVVPPLDEDNKCSPGSWDTLYRLGTSDG
jgi:hypothetical protein